MRRILYRSFPVVGIVILLAIPTVALAQSSDILTISSPGGQSSCAELADISQFARASEGNVGDLEVTPSLDPNGSGATLDDDSTFTLAPGEQEEVVVQDLPFDVHVTLTFDYVREDRTTGSVSNDLVRFKDDSCDQQEPSPEPTPEPSPDPTSTPTPTPPPPPNDGDDGSDEGSRSGSISIEALVGGSTCPGQSARIVAGSDQNQAEVTASLGNCDDPDDDSGKDDSSGRVEVAAQDDNESVELDTDKLTSGEDSDDDRKGGPSNGHDDSETSDKAGDTVNVTAEHQDDSATVNVGESDRNSDSNSLADLFGQVSVGTDFGSTSSRSRFMPRTAFGNLF